VAAEKDIYPYIVYDIPSIFCDGEGGETIVLDIDGWDSNTTGDTTAIENLMLAISGLDKKTLTTDNIVVTFFIENKLALTDTDKAIKRRKYTFSGRLMRG
jgi:hypothetical protein